MSQTDLAQLMSRVVQSAFAREIEINRLLAVNPIARQIETYLRLEHPAIPFQERLKIVLVVIAADSANMGERFAMERWSQPVCLCQKCGKQITMQNTGGQRA
ncbi:MAG: hypothetical protein M3O30_17525 [Planctomycetota bacterium]|nr:hypothetical protein [Planctomycetota bacterium]